MRIINPLVSQAIQAGEGLRINLGCGRRARPGWFGLDLLELPGVDLVADLNQPLDLLPDNSVSEIFTRHTLEHVEAFVPLMRELHRVTRPGGKIEIAVPHFSNPYGYSDPTHVRFFGLYSFFYFCEDADQPKRKVPSFYDTPRFTVETIRLSLLKGGLISRAFLPLLKTLFNAGISMQDWYERQWCRLFPAEGIHFILRPKKSQEGAKVINAAA